MLMKSKDYNFIPDEAEAAFLENLETMADSNDSEFDYQEDSLGGHNKENQQMSWETENIEASPKQDIEEPTPLSGYTENEAEQEEIPQEQKPPINKTNPQQAVSSAFDSSYGATEALINGVSGLIGGTLIGAGKGLAQQGKKLALHGMNVARGLSNINPVEHLSAWRQNIAKKEQSILDARVERIGQFLDEIGEDPVMENVDQRISEGQIDFQDAKNEIGDRLQSDDPDIAQSSFNKKYQSMMEEIKAMQNNNWLGVQDRMRRANDQTALAMANTQEKFDSVMENPVLDKLPDDSKDRLENIKQSIRELMTKIKEFFSKVFGVHTLDDSPKPSM